MMDLSSGFDSPNAFGLRAADFDYDMAAYDVALRFLSDLASGSPEAQALEANGGSAQMLRAWESNTRFRRVLGRCRQANAEEMAFAALKVEAEAEVEGEPGSVVTQRWVPLAEAPVARSVFTP